MTEQRNAHQDNALWQAARQWQQRARQSRPTSRMRSPRLLLTWLMFGVMMIMGAVLGLFFLLMGWLLLPLLRQRMKKRATAFRAHQAGDIGDGFRQTRSSHGSRHQEVLEGEYVVHPEDKR